MTNEKRVSTKITSYLSERKGRGLTLAIDPFVEYPVKINPFLLSGAHFSSSTLLGPACISPGLASITHGPSSFHRWTSLRCEMCLNWKGFWCREKVVRMDEFIEWM